MNITLEQRNAQKLYNYINVANQFAQNKDIYFYLKYNVKTMINQLKISKQDYEALLGHINVFTNELARSHWEPRQFDPKKYDKFLNDFYGKVDFSKIDTTFMLKCKDLLEISQNKNDLYRRRMEFFDKKLPQFSSNNLLRTQIQMKNNNYYNNSNNANILTNTQSSQPINPFAGINEESNPYGNGQNSPYNYMGNSPYQQNNNINNNQKLNAIPPSKMNDLINNSNNIYGINNNTNFESKKKKIPDDIKARIIKELQMVSEEIVNGKIDNCRKHSVEALILFNKVMPEEIQKNSN